MSSVYIICCIVIAIAVLIFLTVKVKLHPFFALTTSAIVFGLLIGQNINDIMTAYAEGLGSTISGIGIVIAIGTVMGALMEKSGGAETMANAILRLTGKKHASLGLAITGYFVSIPVFCDSAFVLLSPLAKRLSRDTGTSMATMAIALSMGLHATHMLVPPTPGPLSVAGILGADLGMVILLGMVVSIPVVAVAMLAGKFLGQKYFYLPEELALETEEEKHQKHPGYVEAFLPILLPILLMLLRTVATLDSAPFGTGLVYDIFYSLGNTSVALLIGLIIAFITYRRIHPEDHKVWTFDGDVGEALKTAGQIVLIVGAGGAFATVLRLSDLESIVTQAFSGAFPRHSRSLHHRCHFPHRHRLWHGGHDHRRLHAAATGGRAGLQHSHRPGDRHAGLRLWWIHGVPRQRRLLLGHHLHFRNEAGSGL